MLPGPRLLILIALAMSACLPGRALAQDGFKILILNSYDGNAMPYAQVLEVFKSELQAGRTGQVAFRELDLQERGEIDPNYDQLLEQLIQLHYTESPPDVVYAIGPPAVLFWLNQRRESPWDVPLIATAGEFALSDLEFRPGDTVVVTPFSFVDQLEAIHRLRPQAKHILMVFGSSSHERGLAALARQQLTVFEDRMSFEYTNDMSLAEIRDRLRNLDPDAAVFYGVFDTDINGVVLSNHSGLDLVRSISTAPVFGVFDDQLGRGIVGGRLFRLNRMAFEAALAAREVERGIQNELKRIRVERSSPEFDWRELQLWGIDSSLLPDGSTVRFKPQGIWEQYSNWIMITAAVLLSLSLLVIFLALQGQRLRQAQTVSSRLGRKLISAQEDERRLIARELHDDLSQQLASLAIDVGYVSAKQGSGEANKVLNELVPRLVGISKDVHDLSYRLHPSMLDDLGLLAALQAEADRFRRRSSAEIIERFGSVPDNMSRDTAICVYRIAQEALNNAIKHAGATVIELALTTDEGAVTLNVADDGVGFDDTSSTAGVGLGLSSMQERAQLAGGVLRISSRPGKGTRVKLVVPLNGGSL